jgi:hypothetical protein
LERHQNETGRTIFHRVKLIESLKRRAGKNQSADAFCFCSPNKHLQKWVSVPVIFVRRKAQEKIAKEMGRRRAASNCNAAIGGNSSPVEAWPKIVPREVGCRGVPHPGAAEGKYSSTFLKLSARFFTDRSYFLSKIAKQGLQHANNLGMSN